MQSKSPPQILIFKRFFVLLLVLTAFSPAVAAAQQPFHNGLSLQGYTGVLNTPNAHVTDEGWLYALYTNQEESKWREKTPFQDNYLFSVGLFNFMELGGRLLEAPKAGRDLSASVKITSAALTRNYPHLPVVAAGVQDLSGGAALLQTSYLVLSEDIWRLRLSAGYGRGPDRMKGAFAGGEFKVHDWVYLLGEYDTKETNIGARLVLPQFWKVPVNFTATAKTSVDYKPGNFDVAIGMSMPLDFKIRPKNAEITSEESGLRDEVRATDLGPKSSNLEPRASSLPSNSSLSLLRDRLVKAGFMNVRTGDAHGGVAVVEYENAIFNHNEMDALGVIAGMATEALKCCQFSCLRIVIKKKNLRMMQLSMPITAVADYLTTGKGLENLKSETVASNVVDAKAGTDFVAGDENSSFLATSFVLRPGLSTIIGAAENGEDLFEYRLSLKPDLYVNLWKGGLLNARWDIPVSWSDKMDDGKMESTMERLMLFQGIKLLPSVMANIGAGMLLHDLYGTMNELVWQPGEGKHRIRIAQTWGEYSSDNRDMESFLASYRYYFSPLDLSLEGTAGKFWSQDRGFSLELKRFFGDTAFSVYYKNSTTTDSKKWQAGGVQIAFPLTPEKDMKHYYKMQLRGIDEWSYAQETTFKNKNTNDRRGELNYIPDVQLAMTPNFTGSLHNQYLNRDRLNESYIMSHLDRLREAWLKYKDKFE
jgi:hypothetical protein